MSVHLLKSIPSIEIAYEIKRVIDIEFHVNMRFRFNLKVGRLLISMNKVKYLLLKRREQFKDVMYASLVKKKLGQLDRREIS